MRTAEDEIRARLEEFGFANVSGAFRRWEEKLHPRGRGGHFVRSHNVSIEKSIQATSPQRRAALEHDLDKGLKAEATKKVVKRESDREKHIRHTVASLKPNEQKTIEGTSITVARTHHRTVKQFDIHDEQTSRGKRRIIGKKAAQTEALERHRVSYHGKEDPGTVTKGEKARKYEPEFAPAKAGTAGETAKAVHRAAHDKTEAIAHGKETYDRFQPEGASQDAVTPAIINATPLAAVNTAFEKGIGAYEGKEKLATPAHHTINHVLGKADPGLLHKVSDKAAAANHTLVSHSTGGLKRHLAGKVVGAAARAATDERTHGIARVVGHTVRHLVSAQHDDAKEQLQRALQEHDACAIAHARALVEATGSVLRSLPVWDPAKHPRGRGGEWIGALGSRAAVDAVGRKGRDHHMAQRAADLLNADEDPADTLTGVKRHADGSYGVGAVKIVPSGSRWTVQHDAAKGGLFDHWASGNAQQRLDLPTPTAPSGMSEGDRARSLPNGGKVTFDDGTTVTRTYPQKSHGDPNEDYGSMNVSKGETSLSVPADGYDVEATIDSVRSLEKQRQDPGFQAMMARLRAVKESAQPVPFDLAKHPRGRGGRFIRDAYVRRAAPLAQARLERAAQAVGLPSDRYARGLSRHLASLFKRAKVNIRVPDDATLEAILRDGEYRPSPVRRQVETPIFGETPVYGYLTGVKGEQTYDDGAHKYGYDRIVLKDSVCARTTVTVGDSLIHLTARDIVPAWLNDPSPTPLSVADPAAIFQPYDVLGLASVNPSSVPNLNPGTAPNTKIPDYFEAQIHGGVKAADIDHVVLANEPNDSLKAALASRQIPWRLWKPEGLTEATSFAASKHPRGRGGRWIDALNGGFDRWATMGDHEDELFPGVQRDPRVPAGAQGAGALPQRFIDQPSAALRHAG
jgi:hypothetical protein